MSHQSQWRHRPTGLVAAPLALLALILLARSRPLPCGAAKPVITSPRSANSNLQPASLDALGSPFQMGAGASLNTNLNTNTNTNNNHVISQPQAPQSQQQAARSQQPTYLVKPGQPRLPSLASSSGPLNISTRSDGASQRIQPSRALFSPNQAPSQPQSQPQQQQQPKFTPAEPPLENPYPWTAHILMHDYRHQLLMNAKRFDEYFRKLLTQSKLALHTTFVDTYGMIYEHNTEIFTNMYEDLEQYYATGHVKLSKSMENFFERLYQKIFQVLNSSRAFSPSYLECATEQLALLKPFKDAPEKLIGDIRHAFVAARTFHQALISGVVIIDNIMSVSTFRFVSISSAISAQA